jgi:four helix bundle protein
MRVAQLAEGLIPDAWIDAEKLRHHPTTANLAAQLYDAIGSIGANIAEGYSRSSGKDRVRFFEYALGSTRECRMWYLAASPVIGPECTANRLDRLEEIRRMLLAIIPRERSRLIRPR